MKEPGPKKKSRLPVGSLGYDIEHAETEVIVPSWHIVIVSAGMPLDSQEGRLLRLQLQDTLEYASHHYARSLSLCIVDTALATGRHPLSLRPPEPGGCPLTISRLTWSARSPDGFPPLAALMNAGVMLGAGADYLLLLHDDILFPGNTGTRVRCSKGLREDTLIAFEEALGSSGVGLAVPRIEGHSPSFAQKFTGLCPAPFFETTEYVSNAVLALKMSDFLANLFPPTMTGYDWWAAYLQRRLARKGRSTVILSDPPFSHTGLVTPRVWGTVASDRFDDNRVAYADACDVKLEYEKRPMEPRIPVWRGQRTYIAVVDSSAQVKRARAAAFASGAWQMILADASMKSGGYGLIDRVYNAAVHPTRAERAVLQDPTGGEPAHFPHLTYVPWMGLDGPLLARYLTSLASAPMVRVVDYRRKPLIETAAGKRVRVGTEYTLLEHLPELHLGFLKGCGIGDLLMMTPGIAALKRVHPHIRVVCHAAWECGDVLRHNPDIAEVRVYNPGQTPPPVSILDCSGGNAKEGTIRWLFEHLGLPKNETLDRRLRYYVQPDEVARATAYLEGLGIGLQGMYLVGMQLHGSWDTKHWKHAPEFVRLLLAETNATLILTGHESRFSEEEIPDSPRIIRLMNRLKIRDAIALLTLLDAWVGFDSGFTFAAAALSVPCVALHGPHNPKGLVGDCQAHNLITIRKRTPKQCEARFGTSCRVAKGLYGQKCPLRPEGMRGGDCMDAISASAAMMELMRLRAICGPMPAAIGERAYMRR